MTMSDDFFAVAAKDDAIAALRDRLAALERELADLRQRYAEVERAFRAGYRAAERQSGALVDVNAEGAAVTAWTRYQQERQA
jgi:uncharacterized protein (DUF3084 family)